MMIGDNTNGRRKKEDLENSDMNKEYKKRCKSNKYYNDDYSTKCNFVDRIHNIHKL